MVPVFPSVYRTTERRILRGFAVASLVSLAVLIADRFAIQRATGSGRVETKASEIMVQALAVVREHRTRLGPPIDRSVDPNSTGLIGLEFSEITTTLGDLEAKRTTTSPEMAALLVELLNDADVRQGDRLAVGCSGSFPGFFVAILAASRALEVEPVVVVSLGASSYGANRLDFTVLDLSLLLNESGVLPHVLAATSLGGSQDLGMEFEPEVRTTLVEKVRRAGVPLIQCKSLKEAVESRVQSYGEVAAFVNIGGSYADMGADPWILNLGPGLHTSMSVPDSVTRKGVLLTMAERGIPVLHLLHVRGLAERYGLSWDPVPLTATRRINSAFNTSCALILYGIGLICGFLVARGPSTSR